jgi:5-methylcytosine-specific restriction endonuclease McrA
VGPASPHGERDPRQLNAFKKQHPCPSTGKTYGSCPGYTVDHVVPLKRGGADAPYNMQWQTEAAAKQ